MLLQESSQPHFLNYPQFPTSVPYFVPMLLPAVNSHFLQPSTSNSILTYPPLNVQGCTAVTTTSTTAAVTTASTITANPTTTATDWAEIEKDVKIAGFKTEEELFTQEEKKILFDNSVGSRKSALGLFDGTERRLLKELMEKMDEVTLKTMECPLDNLNPDVTFLLTKFQRTIAKWPIQLHKVFHEMGDVGKLPTTKDTRSTLLKHWVLPVIVKYARSEKKTLRHLFTTEDSLFLTEDLIEKSLAEQVKTGASTRNVSWAWLSLCDTIINVTLVANVRDTNDGSYRKFDLHYNNLRKHICKMADIAGQAAETARVTKDNKKEMEEVKRGIKLYVKSPLRRKLLELTGALAEAVRKGNIQISSPVYNFVANLTVGEMVAAGTYRIGGIVRMTNKQFYRCIPVFVDEVNKMVETGCPSWGCRHQKVAKDVAEQIGITANGDRCCESSVSPAYFITSNQNDKGSLSKKTGYLMFQTRQYKMMQDYITIKNEYFRQKVKLRSKLEADGKDLFVNSVGHSLWDGTLTVFNEVRN